MLCLLFSAKTFAQDVPKLEVGIHATLIKLGDFRISLPQFDETQRGFGGRMTVNVTEHFSIEGEVNLFPKDYRLNVITTQNTLRELVNQDRTVQTLVGVKYGVRSNRFGLFAKARPGYTRVRLRTEIDDLPGAPRPRDDIFRWNGGYCLDLGGVFEIYPTKLLQLRFDFGNTRIRYKERALSPQGQELDFYNLNYTRNNLQIMAGIGFRF
jgi:hypothetical protein